MRTKDNGKYNTAGNTGKKKCAAFNWLKGVTAVLCAVAMYFAVTTGIRGYDMYKDAIAQVSLEDKVSEIRSKESYTVFSDLPETYTDAVLSVEDHRFYGHIGIDPIAITRAMVNDMKAGRFVEGGSTITQQLAESFSGAFLQKLAEELYAKSDLKDKKGIVPQALPFYAGNKFYMFYKYTRMCVWWQLLLLLSVSLAEKQITGCGPVIPVTSLCSVFMRMPTESRQNTVQAILP